MARIEIKGIIGKDYTYPQFITDFAAAKGETIQLFVDSPGGSVYEGDAISDFIQSKLDNFISVQNTGDVASIASSIFLSLPYEKRFFNPSKGVALIHNPYLDPQSLEYMDTTADGLGVISSELKTEEDKISKFIAKQTETDIDVVKAMMQINEPLTVEQLQAINFANIIQYKAVAFLKPIENNMKDEEIKTLIETGNKTLIESIKGWFRKTTKFVAVMLTDANGGQIEFIDVPEGVEPVVGDMGNLIGGGALNGEVVMADGKTFVFENGKITEIKEPTPADPPAPDQSTEELNAKISDLETKLSDALKAQTSLKAQIKSQMISVSPTEKPIDNDAPKAGRKLSEIIK